MAKNQKLDSSMTTEQVENFMESLVNQHKDNHNDWMDVIKKYMNNEIEYKQYRLLDDKHSAINGALSLTIKNFLKIKNEGK